MKARSSSRFPLAALEPPPPPRELRARALAAAHAARRTPATDLWSRLWVSRRLRLAWATAVVGLLLAHLAVSLGSHPAAPPATEPLLMATTVSDPEIEAFLELEPIASDPLPHLGERGRAASFGAHDERSQHDAS